MMRLLAFMFLLVSFLGNPAMAHTTSQSFSSWQVNGKQVESIFAVDARRITQLAQLYELDGGLYPLLESHLRETISVRQQGAVCDLQNISPLTSSGSIIRAQLGFSCSAEIADSGAAVTIAAFHTVSATHIHIARISSKTSELTEREVLLSEAQPVLYLTSSHTPSSIPGFIKLGFDHVLSGPDHLAFLAALMLLAGSIRRALIAVTGFTLGHSITLALAVLGIIEPREQMIEALIAFTIATTALEAGLAQQRKAAFRLFACLTALVILPSGLLLPFGTAVIVYVLVTAQLSHATALKLLPAIAIAFGLVHGAGFAGGLTELDLSGSNLLAPLVGFNIGVELGQILALAVIASAATLLRKILPRTAQIQAAWLALPLFCAGCFWFAERMWT
ncbi:MAG: HupE/UreJ family protein [Aquisalinus sp.]|nr:HupE/UreJ family protein [Aquisalinus sp.]